MKYELFWNYQIPLVRLSFFRDFARYLRGNSEPCNEIALPRTTYRSRVKSQRMCTRYGPPYCGYQAGTCPTCGLENSPTLVISLAECPTIQRQGTNVVCPIVLTRASYVHAVNWCAYVNTPAVHDQRESYDKCRYLFTLPRDPDYIDPDGEKWASIREGSSVSRSKEIGRRYPSVGFPTKAVGKTREKLRAALNSSSKTEGLLCMVIPRAAHPK